MRKRRIVGVACAALLVAGMAGACSKNTGENTKGPAIRQDAGSISTDPAESQGPAKPMPGAVRGGTLYSIQQTDYETLDPQQIYVNASIAVGQLFTRTLTMFRKDPNTGKDLLVGDLATGTGTDVDHDGKTWRYTLKKGLKYEDGSSITAADVAYGVARSFSPQVAEGPHYIQQWLTGRTDYNKTYQGPYDGGAKLPPGVTVSGRTITFHLQQAEPDFPFAASMGTTTPLPPSRDKGRTRWPTTRSRPARTRSSRTSGSASWCWCATGTGIRAPTRYGTTTSTGSSSRWGPRRSSRPTGCSPTTATTGTRCRSTRSRRN
ncbi:hypothetical protein Athai_51640 [Actinocatenispora thailandica]|uniref:Solute-binding protein family 5 domain-containing protein n=1 Tax=Actinocatenispora thailandica TaxID=227318 RepID=A0A7R7DTV0_9ACTN|nr:hypothetical protein Athai_51640 [Actinocatenispora thailandica]